MVSTIAHLGVIIYNAISDVKTEMTLNQGCSIYYNQQRQFAAAAALATGYSLGGTARVCRHLIQSSPATRWIAAR